MPNDASIIGFTNPWYIDGMHNSINYPLEVNLNIRIFAPAWYLASKMVAFSNRGKYDFRTSSDFEDIIYVLDNKSLLLNDLKTKDLKVRQYLKSEFQKYLLDANVSEGIYCALPYSSGNERIERIKSIMKEISEL